jgi:hypothetical protein
MSGEFGNKGPNWDTMEEFLASGYAGLVHLRNRRAGGPTYYNVPAAEVVRKWKETGAIDEPSQWYLAAMAPTDKTLFQGEVQQTPLGLSLYYSTVVKPMRDSLREGGQQVQGIISVSLLKHYLCHNSLDWLYVLLERYPDHVVEFSTYGVNWGTLPGFNTVIWEVRMY